MASFPKRKTSVLLITGKAEKGFNIAPPIGVYQLLNYLVQRNHDCEIFDQEIETEAEYLKNVEAGKYDVIGMSVSHDHMPEDLDLYWRFKFASEKSDKRSIFIAGGQEATLNWKQWLRLGVDLIFLGFAEKILLKFCSRIASRYDQFESGLPLPDLIEGMDGVAYTDPSGEAVNLPTAHLEIDEFRELFFKQRMISDYPFQDYWDMVKETSVGASLGASRFVFENVRVYTSSHCPRKCGFCQSQNFLIESQNSNLPILMLSAEEVAELVVMHVKKTKAKGFLFSDDDFPIGSKPGLDRLRDFCKIIIGYKSSGLIPEDIPFSCQSRVSNFLRGVKGKKKPNLELMELMVDAGFMAIAMGVETFSDRILKAPSINKIGITSEDCQMVIDAMLNIGLVPQLNLIMGIPEYTVEEVAETIRTAAKLMIKGCNISPTQALEDYPGSPIHGKELYEAKTKSWIHPLTGEKIAISDYFVPQDPKIANAISKLEESYQEEVEAFNKSKNWEGKVLAKQVVAIIKMKTFARLLDLPDLVKELRVAMQQILEGKYERNEYVS